jgi:predicted ribosome quality control (RQC) complex YloA/Tae2 family protein
MYQLRRGEPLARLDDWEGRTVEFEIDPRLSPAENAAKFYEEARRRERAAERLPELIGEAETEVEKWQEAAAETAAGRLPEWIIERLARRDAASQKLPSAGKGQDRDSLPYRTFRTFGGLEVRVGRGAKENDRLTFGNSAPNDIWLHVQGAPGSHVILRWKDASAAPPARDLAEAAQLAAVFSRARTSSLVAVDWTRRKHVRKPRGAPPGMVAPQQVKTVFVEPDPGITDRLAVRE